MKKIDGLLLIIAFLVLMPMQINAFCDTMIVNSEKATLKKIASNVTFSTFYEETDDQLVFSIRINNLDKSLKVVDNKTKEEIFYGLNTKDMREYIVGNYQPGQSVQFNFFVLGSDCISEEEILMVRYVNLPYYNKYYKDPLCVGLSNNLICRKWANVKLDYDDFKNEIVKLKEEVNEENDKEEDDEIGFISLFELIKEYYIYLLGLGILVVGYRMYMRRKDDFKL